MILHAARPGVIIGRKGQEVEQLQDELQQLVGRRINIKIEEVNRPELQAQLVAEDIGEQLSKRASFRRTMKRSVEQTMEAGAKGIKVQLAGRLGGSEMARREKSAVGSIPLSTLRAGHRLMLHGLAAESLHALLVRGKRQQGAGLEAGYGLSMRHR